MARGAAHARVAYGRVLKDVPFAPRWGLLSTIIAFERSLPQTDAARVVPLYEKAAAADGATRVELWRSYMGFLESVGNFEGAGHVYDRAVKSLDDADAFINQHRCITRFRTRHVGERLCAM